MTVQIPKSMATPELLVRIEAFRQAKLAHQKTTDVPAPVEHDLIEACIKRMPRGDAPDDLVADYQIVDDTPSPEERKTRLLAQVSEAENAALAIVSPIGKRRLYAMRVGEIIQTEETARSADDRQFLAEESERKSRCDKINRHAAELHAEIEDLPDHAAIDAWSMRPFP